MRHYFVSLLLVFTSLNVLGQYFEVKVHHEVHSEGEAYTFPVLVNKKNPEAANKINSFIQKTQLDTVITPAMKKGVFARMWPKEGEVSGISNYGYRIIANNDRYFCIEFSGESCGAYCENFEQSFCFNAMSGEQILLKDILSEKGFIFFDKALQFERQARIFRHVSGLKSELKQNPEDNDVKEFNSEAIEMYNQCTQWRQEREGNTETDYNDLYLTDTLIKVVGERCSNHASRALDDLGEFENSIQVKTISALLSPKGRRLLDVKSEDPFSLQQKIYKGTIGSMLKVHFFIAVPTSGAWMSGVYFYDRFGQFIKLKGSQKDNEFVLYEEDESGRKAARITLKKSVSGLKGKWTDLESSKELPVVLTPLEK